MLDGDPHSDYINANYIDVRLSMGLGSWVLGLATVGSRSVAVSPAAPPDSGPPRTGPEGLAPPVTSVTRAD